MRVGYVVSLVIVAHDRAHVSVDVVGLGDMQEAQYSLIAFLGGAIARRVL
jgi:hypothetical protein